MENKKHLDFCKKYPETIVGYDIFFDNIFMYYNENKKIPVVDIFEVQKLIKIYNENPIFFTEYKDLKDEWNELCEISNKKI